MARGTRRGRPGDESLLDFADLDDAARPRAGARTLLRFEADRPAPPGDLPLRDLRHPLWLHPEVSDHLRAWTHLYRRLGIVLQHLAAHGRTTVVKGCTDGNRGWRRSPLGGAHGMQYYLWWTPQGSRTAQALALPERAILVRAVRHHDDHAPLDAGHLDDYLPLSAPDHLDDDIAGRPWTEAQLDFIEDDSPVRLILGRPGSGKTTVLWRAVEARSGQRVLYLTWSSALTRHAEERFASFAPADVEVTARDFATFLGEACGADVPRQPLAASRERFDAAVTRLGRDMAGPWKTRLDAMHAEVRALLFGHAIPGEVGCTTERGVARLRDDVYTARRGGYDGVGTKAARALLKVSRALPPNAVRAVFPELTAAAQAIERLRDDLVPEGFDAFDRIVVDEVQDLTLVETAVVVELCRAIARRRGRAPWLLLAGDAGQTVRPTGFDWGPLNDLLARRVRTPVRFHLEEHLRCPSRIAEVIERASERYADVVKEVRPTKQRRQVGGQHVDAHVVHVQVAERAGAVRLLEDLADADDVVVLSPGNDPPAWVPERLRDGVLTPAEAKGLEYQSVCVLDPGRVLSSLRPLEMEYGTAAELDQQARRTAIDHLRVTLSRATETLVFVDVAPADRERALSLELLGDAAPYDPEDLVDHFSHAEAAPEERVAVRTNDARALIDSAPGRAWQRARQAIRLLGDPDLPNGVSDPAVRRDARTTLMATAARLLVDGPPAGVSRSEVYRVALDALIVRVVPARDRRAAPPAAASAGSDGGDGSDGGGDHAGPESREAGVKGPDVPAAADRLRVDLPPRARHLVGEQDGAALRAARGRARAGRGGRAGPGLGTRCAAAGGAGVARRRDRRGRRPAARRGVRGGRRGGVAPAHRLQRGRGGPGPGAARPGLRCVAQVRGRRHARPGAPQAPRAGRGGAARHRARSAAARPAARGAGTDRGGRRRVRAGRGVQRRAAPVAERRRLGTRGRAGRRRDPRRPAVAHRARGARRPAARAAEPAPAERRARPPRTPAGHRPEAPRPEVGRAVLSTPAQGSTIRYGSAGDAGRVETASPGALQNGMTIDITVSAAAVSTLPAGAGRRR